MTQTQGWGKGGGRGHRGKVPHAPNPSLTQDVNTIPLAKVWREIQRSPCKNSSDTEHLSTHPGTMPDLNMTAAAGLRMAGLPRGMD